MDEQIEVRVRRAPKYGVFLAFGALLGIVGALVLFGVSGNRVVDGEPQGMSPSEFGFFAVSFALAGMILAGAVAIILERVANGRSRTTRVTGVFEEVRTPAARTSPPGTPTPGTPAEGAAPETPASPEDTPAEPETPATPEAPTTPEDTAPPKAP